MFRKVVIITVALLLFPAIQSLAKTTLVTKVPLSQEIGQMLIIGFNGEQLHNGDAIVKDIKAQRIGGVILFDYNYQTKTFDRNIKNPKQVQLLTSQLQNYATAAAQQHHNHINPLFIAVDYEGGEITRLQAQYGFPKTYSAQKLGELPLRDTIIQATAMAKTLQRNHFNLDFAPVLDVNVNPNNPVIAKKERSFSAKPMQVAVHAAIFSKVFQQNHIQCVYKHFPGHGSSTTDSHLGFVDVSKTWSPKELIPYQEMFKTPYACNFVMTAHIVNRQLDSSGLPATLSHKILTGVLRNKLHFKGIIISDDMQMKAITKYYGLKQALKLGINAGDDMFIFGNQLAYQPHIAEKVIKIVTQLVQSGAIPRAKIDAAYNRIMAVKKAALRFN